MIYQWKPSERVKSLMTSICQEPVLSILSTIWPHQPVFGRSQSLACRSSFYIRNTEYFEISLWYAAMSNVMMDSGSHCRSLGGTSLISGLIPNDLIRKWAIIMSHPDGSTGICNLFPQLMTHRGVPLIYQSVVFQAVDWMVKPLATVQESVKIWHD